jgi:hypothetical protein
MLFYIGVILLLMIYTVTFSYFIGANIIKTSVHKSYTVQAVDRVPISVTYFILCSLVYCPNFYTFIQSTKIPSYFCINIKSCFHLYRPGQIPNTAWRRSTPGYRGTVPWSSTFTLNIKYDP